MNAVAVADPQMVVQLVLYGIWGGINVMGLIIVDCCNIKMSRVFALLYIFFVCLLFCLVFFLHKAIMIVLQPGGPNLSVRKNLFYRRIGYFILSE